MRTRVFILTNDNEPDLDLLRAEAVGSLARILAVVIAHDAGDLEGPLVCPEAVPGHGVDLLAALVPRDDEHRGDGDGAHHFDVVAKSDQLGHLLLGDFGGT